MDWMLEMTKRFPAFDESAPAKQKEICEVYKRFAKISVEKFNAQDGLCFLNCYLDLKDFTVYEHDKNRINTILLPYNYDLTIGCPVWLKSINEIFENDFNRIKCVQDFFGYCLTRQTEYHKALFCIGEGATGKSTVLDCLAEMVGDENVSVLSPRFYKDSMRITAIENKLVLMSHEIPKRLEDYEAEFRQIVCGQKLDVNKKYIAPYKFKPFCKIILAMNELPRIDDHTSAFYRRILPVEFNRQFLEEEQIRRLDLELKKEIPGILNWSLEGLKRLRERNGFFTDAYMKEHLEEIKFQNNPIAVYAEEKIRVEDGKEITKSEIYKDYNIWCGLNGHKATSSAKFSMEFYRIFKKVTKKNFRRASGDRANVWKNLTWAGFENIPTENQHVWDD